MRESIKERECCGGRVLRRENIEGESSEANQNVLRLCFMGLGLNVMDLNSGPKCPGPKCPGPKCPVVLSVPGLSVFGPKCPNTPPDNHFFHSSFITYDWNPM